MRRARYAVAGLVVVAAGGIAVSGAAISLGTAVPLVAQHAAFAVAIADVTGDGHGDLIVPGYYSSKVSVHAGNGDGTFGTPFDLATSAEKFTSRIRTAWLNGDAAQNGEDAGV